MNLLPKQFLKIAIAANSILIGGISLAASCPPITVVSQTISKLKNYREVDNISASGAVWRARSNFYANAVRGRTFKFQYATLNASAAAGGPAAAVCQYSTVGYNII